MNISIPLLITMPLFLLAYYVYARYIARILGLDASRPTPAVELCDNVDYVPTKLGVVFSHHFASIAGGGPILGPTLGLIYGYNITFLWLLIGCIFFGAVHDFTALFVSVRERGRSMAEVARKSLGDFGFLLFIAFTIIMLFMVVVAFLGATVAALTSKYPLALMGLSPDQTLLKTVVEDGVVKGRIGGIASTSVIVITCCAPLLGYLLYVRKIPVWIASVLALAVCAVSIEIGVRHPVSVTPELWRGILCVYVFIAAGIPVWVILQPRDFTNSFILYIGIAVMTAAILYGGLSNAGGAAAQAAFTIGAPGFNFAEGASKLGAVWPILFITVACGAISGFHSLVAGGTSSKQLCNEAHTKTIGYGGMLLEGLFAVAVLSVVAAGISFGNYKEIVFPTVPGTPGNPILAFALGTGVVINRALGIPLVYGTVFGILLVEGFVVTTLDTAVRLTRYLLEELWGIVFKTVPRILKSYIFNAALIVGIAYLMALGNSINKIWPIFGAANQLLAALVLIVVAVWLSQRKKRTWFVTIPAAFMLVTSISSLVYLLLNKYLKTQNWPLVISDLLLMALSAGVIVMLVQRFFLKPQAAASGG
ncbi:MAG: carbon starvation CstA family protein [bacterium]